MAEFSASELATIRNVCDTLVPSLTEEGPRQAFFARQASDIGVDQEVVRTVQEQFGILETEGFHRLLHTVESPITNLLLGLGPVRFSALGPDARARYLSAWRDSVLGIKRTGFQALKRLACSLFYAGLDSTGANANWSDIGYQAMFPEPPPPRNDAHLILPVIPEGEAELTADVCVIGSGAGGSVLALEVQQAGFSTVVLEAGPYSTGQSVIPNEFEMTRRSFERGGTLTTDDLSFQLLAGRGAGGGTFVNWMTCLRPPAQVLEEWETTFGLTGLTSSEFQRDVDYIWTTLEVSERESQRNSNNDALWRGALALGYREGPDFQVLARNAVGCRQRCDFCGFGCVYDCKRSTVLNFLPGAYRAGARFLFNTCADEVELDGGRVRAVRARYRGTDGSVHAVRVRCRVVVLAAGAIGTPLVLLRSGIVDRAIGRGLRLHPTTAVAGEMASEVRPWAGPPQTVAVTRFMDWDGWRHGFWMEAAPAHPGLFALATPWTDGRSHKEWMSSRYARSTSTIVLLREWSRGRVSLDAHGEARIHYRLGAADREQVKRGIRETGRLLAAAGATRLATLHNVPVDVQAAGDRLTPRDVERFGQEVEGRSLAPNRCLMFSAHLMGSCPMGRESGNSAVRPTGELWSVENAFVADASVFPSSPGVNPMITIMALARRTGRSVVDRLKSRPN